MPLKECNKIRFTKQLPCGGETSLYLCIHMCPRVVLGMFHQKDQSPYLLWSLIVIREKLTHSSLDEISNKPPILNNQTFIFLRKPHQPDPVKASLLLKTENVICKSAGHTNPQTHCAVVVQKPSDSPAFLSALFFLRKNCFLSFLIDPQRLYQTCAPSGSHLRLPAVFSYWSLPAHPLLPTFAKTEDLIFPYPLALL